MCEELECRGENRKNTQQSLVGFFSVQASQMEVSAAVTSILGNEDNICQHVKQLYKLVYLRPQDHHAIHTQLTLIQRRGYEGALNLQLIAPEEPLEVLSPPDFTTRSIRVPLIGDLVELERERRARFRDLSNERDSHDCTAFSI